MPKFQIFKKLNPDDIIIVPYKSHADYEFTGENYNDNDLVISNGIYTSNIYKNDILPIDSRLIKFNEPISDGGFYKRIIHDHLRTYYYNLDSFLKRSNNTHLFLYENANLISIPHIKYGENINPKSIELEYYYQNRTSSFVDDGFYNIIDDEINTDNFITGSSNFLYIGFEDKYHLKKQKKFNSGVLYKNLDYIFSYDLLNYKKTSIGNFYNVNYSDGVELKTIPSSSGTKVDLNGFNSYIEINNTSETSLKDAPNYAISFWANINSIQKDINTDKNVIISKRFNEQEFYYNIKNKQSYYKQNNKLNKKYPYEIGIYNTTGKLYVNKSDGQKLVEVTSSIDITGNQHHFLVQKSGSNLQLYIDNQLNNEKKDEFSSNNENESNILIGTLDKESQMLSGSLDEIRFFNKSLSNNEIYSLSNNDFFTGSLYQNNIIGNVFYEEGLISISSPMPKYRDLFLNESFKLKYQSTITNYENKIICKISKSEFNNSLNPTLRIGNTEESNELKKFVTSNEFRTYITEIGLYDDYGRLLVIGKLPHPIQKQNDVDLNFLIKFDI